MPDYTFPNLNSKVSIKSPKVRIVNVNDHNNGTASIDIELSVANAPQGQAPNFGVTFTGFTYTGDQPMKVDVEAWVENELIKYKS